MHILFTRFPLKSAYGGAEVQTLSLVEGLRKRGHDIAFLGSCPVLLDWMPELHLKKYELHIGSPPVTMWGAVSFLWRQFFMKHKLIQTIKKSDINHFLPTVAPPLACHGELNESIHARGGVKTGQPTAILMLSLSEKILLTPWAVKRGMNVLWIEHDRIGHWLTKNPWLSRLRKMSTLVTTICVSNLSKKMYIDLGWDPKRVIAIPNGIDERRLNSDQSDTMTLPRDVFHIGCIARLTPDKGIDLLIEAVSHIPHVHLTIVGRGSDAHSLATMIEDINTKAHE